MKFEAAKGAPAMKVTLLASIATLALAATLTVNLTATAGAQSVQPSATDKVTIEGWALNMSNVATGANQSIRITIDKWSTAKQRELLISTFLEKKDQRKLLSVLEDQPEVG